MSAVTADTREAVTPPGYLHHVPSVAPEEPPFLHHTLDVESRRSVLQPSPPPVLGSCSAFGNYWFALRSGQMRGRTPIATFVRQRSGAAPRYWG